MALAAAKGTALCCEHGVYGRVHASDGASLGKGRLSPARATFMGGEGDNHDTL